MQLEMRQANPLRFDPKTWDANRSNEDNWNGVSAVPQRYEARPSSYPLPPITKRNAELRLFYHTHIERDVRKAAECVRVLGRT